MHNPPMIAAPDKGVLRGGGRSWSINATRKIVRRAATEERTGEVRDMSIKKEPENTIDKVR